ncbi:hypothetical protein ACFU99_16675 [Streptomyces sp. NPDC057654]|uniref:hypothetical protein n=1 Tax=Streptomyces sp. NPDC057654 TaxID=3346196 RepID=UPI00369C7393
MPLPSWMQSHLHNAQPPRYSFESFANEVARLLGLPPALRTGDCELSSETGHVRLSWKPDADGAALVLHRPRRTTRECLVIKVSWHHCDPADIAAIARAYERRGRIQSIRSLMTRMQRRK